MDYTRLSVLMDAETTRKLKYISVSNDTNITDAVQRAVSIAYHIEKALEAGSTIWVNDADNRRTSQMIVWK